MPVVIDDLTLVAEPAAPTPTPAPPPDASGPSRVPPYEIERIVHQRADRLARVRAH